MMKQLQVCLTFFLLLVGTQSYAQNNYTISGYVKEKGSGELLPGVTIYDANLQLGTTTNTYGFYSLTLPAGSRQLVYTFVGYERVVKTIDLKDNITLDLDFLPSTVELETVEVNATAQERVSESVEMSKMILPVSQIQDLPAFLGEKDVIKTLQLMPGVQSGREGSSDLHVRGGGGDQNLLILDDAVVYNANHLFGFFSVFNGEALKSVEVYKGGFPARYGGRLSSVIDMNMKEGNKEEFHGSASVGLISSSATVEGPLKKGKSSFLVSGRRTYVDILTRPFMDDDFNAGYYFYDLNTKVNYDFGPKNKVYVSGYFGRDRFYSSEDYRDDEFKAGLEWGNATGTVRWNHLFNQKLFANATLIASNYKFGLFQDERYQEYHPDGREEVHLKMRYNSNITDYSFKYDLDYMPTAKHQLKMGVILTNHRFSPSAFVFKGPETDIDERQLISTLEGGVYIEDIYKPTARLTLNPGFRLSTFYHEGRTYVQPEPRFNVSYVVSKDLAIKASYAMMNQYVHRLSNTGIGLPTDLWVSSTKNVLPQTSQQVAAGLAKDIDKYGLTLTVEGYYKRSINAISYKEGASFLFLENLFEGENNEVDWENNITRGNDTSYGVEVMLQRKVGRLSGWVGYTLSWSERQFDELNLGKSFYAPWDQRHDLSIAGSYKISDRVSVGATWVYGSGTPLTMAVAKTPSDVHSPELDAHAPKDPLGQTYYSYQPTRDYYGTLSNFRRPAYHRMDIAFRFHKQKKYFQRTWEVGAYNVYNRQNMFFYTTDYEYDYRNDQEYAYLQQVSLFPVIPYVSYKVTF
ncbi:TonB-dependent receptor [Algivirga pacifica]|uniref:TonB-dependent receptor n=1 Tax=Algivirga pacifica TaxID=1162670 RepID=A0ABP9DJB1_9BACT